MNNEEIAGNISERMHQIITLPAQLSRVEMLRELSGDVQAKINDHNQNILSIAKQKALLKVDLQELSKDLLAAVLELDQTLSILYRPIDAPAAIIQEVARKARTTKGTVVFSETIPAHVNPPLQGETSREAQDETAAPKAETEGGKTGEVKAVHAGAPEPAAERERFPCLKCGDTFYKLEWLENHTCVADPVRSICADCLGNCEMDGTPRDPHPKMTACTGHRTEPDEDQTLWRNTTCQGWRACPFTAKCFGPSNEENPTCFKEDKIRELGTSALASMPVDSHQERHNKLVAERCVAGDDINDSGVFLNPEEIIIQIPPKAKHDAAIEIAVNADGEYCYGYDFKVNVPSSIEGCSGAPSISGPFFASREDAILAALAFLTTRWPNKKIPGRKVALDCVNVYYMEIVKQAAEATAAYVPCQTLTCEFNNPGAPDSCNEPDREERPVVRCCDYTSVPVKEKVVADLPQKEEAKPYVPEDCDDCGNRGILDGTDDYCNCPHGVRARKADQAELERRKERKASLAEVVQADELQPATFNPLDEPLGDCESCMGYGVVEGELFGESSFIPCNCQAGKKVAGEKWIMPRKDLTRQTCCNDCQIGDPDCHSCDLPNQVESEMVADMLSGLTTEEKNAAPVIDQNRTCCMPPDRDWAETPTTRILYCRVCNLIHRMTDGKGIDLPFNIGTKFTPDAAIIPEAVTPPAGLTKLQQKCTHPTVFRTPVEGGFYCKCCKQTILSGGGRDSLPFSLTPPTGFE